MQEHYNNILEFNSAFEVEVCSEELFSSTSEKNKKIIKFRMSLIKEEVKELEEAIRDKDFTEVVDALNDILYVAYGAMIAFSFQLENAYIKNNNNREKVAMNIFRYPYRFNMDKVIYRQLGNILIICSNLEQAVAAKDILNTNTALQDLIHAAYKSLDEFNVDYMKSFSIVHLSNMSKLCSSEQEAIETVESYKNAIPIRYEFPAYRESKVYGKWIVYNNSAEPKILKNINYVPANFSQIIAIL